MRILLQRVSKAQVAVAASPVAAIGPGLLLLVGFGAEDEADDGAMLAAMARKTLDLRIFADETGKMNLSALDRRAAILAVSQFTLHADCRRGRRPGFNGAARPERARPLFDQFIGLLRASALDVQTGVFGAMMQVELVNDGPVTIWLDSDELALPPRHAQQ